MTNHNYTHTIDQLAFFISTILHILELVKSLKIIWNNTNMGIMLGSNNAKQIKIVFHQSATHVDFIFEVYRNKCKNKTK